jgi:hypothetical protein
VDVEVDEDERKSNESKDEEFDDPFNQYGDNQYDFKK